MIVHRDDAECLAGEEGVHGIVLSNYQTFHPAGASSLVGELACAASCFAII